MLRWVGAALVFAGCGALGILLAGRLSGKVKALRAMAAALEQMEREMGFRLASMPELLESAAKTVGPPADGFFQRCLDGLEQLGEKSLAEIWEETLDWAGDLGDPALAALRGLGVVLGQYDGESQRESLAGTRRELERCLQEARAEQARLGRVYTTLGITAGAVLAILLL